MDIDRLIRSLLAREVTLFGVSRVPFYFGSTRSSYIDIEKVIKGGSMPFSNLGSMISLKVNPDSLTLTPEIRVSYVKTAGGRAYYHWLNEDRDSIEAFSLRMRGSTGSLLPGSRDARVKLYNFLKLRELTLEPYWVYDKDGVKTRNHQFILAYTIGLGIAVLFIGFYTKPIVLSEDASRQYNITWEIDFIVEYMLPSYKNLSSMVSSSVLVPDILRKVFGEL